MTKHNIVSAKASSRRYLGAGYGAMTFMRPPRSQWSGWKTALVVAVGLSAAVGALAALERLAQPAPPSLGRDR